FGGAPAAPGKKTSTGRSAPDGALGISAPSPRPRPRRFSAISTPLSGRIAHGGGVRGAALGDLASRGEVGERARRAGVVRHHRLSVAGCLGDANGSRHRGSERLVGEMLTDL